ncbi:unnamed protein product [Blepharisma stoltei]|uniref:Uncharacterized protein n=1 Tax=Blepharisma stoltei TaxID=1481888 RepID=A0AAU9JHE7_9CILI|nr:unnamed protein product [Blepharisma stoltei]
MENRVIKPTFNASVPNRPTFGLPVFKKNKEDEYRGSTSSIAEVYGDTNYNAFLKDDSRKRHTYDVVPKDIQEFADERKQSLKKDENSSVEITAKTDLGNPSSNYFETHASTIPSLFTFKAEKVNAENKKIESVKFLKSYKESPETEPILDINYEKITLKESEENENPIEDKDKRIDLMSNLKQETILIENDEKPIDTKTTEEYQSEIQDQAKVNDNIEKEIESAAKNEKDQFEAIESQISAQNNIEQEVELIITEDNEQVEATETEFFNQYNSEENAIIRPILIANEEQKSENVNFNAIEQHDPELSKEPEIKEDIQQQSLNFQIESSNIFEAKPPIPAKSSSFQVISQVLDINIDKQPRRTKDPDCVNSFSLSIPGRNQVQSSSSSLYFPLPDQSSPIGAKLSSLSRQLSIDDSHAEEEIDVLCVNCYECIPSSKVDEHSKTCTIPQEEPESESSQINLRIQKLKKSISGKIEGSYGDKVLILMQLQELACAAYDSSVSSYDILSRLDSIVKSSSSMPDGISCVIFARRLSNLIDLKGHFSPKQYTMNEEEMLKFYEEEAERQKKELERWKLRSELLLQFAGNACPEGFNEVNSDLSSEYDNISVISYSTGYSDFPSDIGRIEEAEQALQAISEEQLEKYFYTICIKKKFELPKNHPGHELEIAKLYETCREDNIPVSKWEEYVIKCFS